MRSDPGPGVLAWSAALFFLALLISMTSFAWKALINPLSNAEVNDLVRRISPLMPHDLRHTSAYRLAAETGDAYALEWRLGRGSQRYTTNPPEAITAGYEEDF